MNMGPCLVEYVYLLRSLFGRAALNPIDWFRLVPLVGRDQLIACFNYLPAGELSKFDATVGVWV